MRLELSIENPNTTTLEGVRVGLALVNESAQAYRLPGPYDLTNALTIEVRRSDGVLVRRLDGFTRQAMTSSARIDSRPSLDDLPALGVWRWDLDLAAYHYTLPAGELTLRAVYSVPNDSLLLQSADVPVSVGAVPLRSLAYLVDAPVLDGLTLLLHGEGPEKTPITVLRQYEAQRPLAAWYSRRIDLDGGQPVSFTGPVKPFFAAASFSTTDSFEPTFVKWIISTDSTRLFAHRVFQGALDPKPLIAPLPEGRALIPSAYYDEDERLTVFLQRPTGTLEAYHFAPDGLRLLFLHHVPRTPLPPAIRADCDFIYILTPWQGAIYDRLSLRGEPRERRKPFTTRMTAVLCDIDAVRRRGRLLFRDGPRGRALQLVTFEPRRHRTDSLALDDLPMSGEIREVSFDRDESGRFHLLVATSARKLYYLRNGRGPTLILQGEERFFPIVQAGGGLYLGCHSVLGGYRFLYFQQRAHSISSFEELP
jgi:hypothetical protein